MRFHPNIEKLRSAAPTIAYTRAAIVDSKGKLRKPGELLEKRIVEGYGCIWGAKNMHGERFHKGAFERSIRENGPGSGANYEIKFRDRHGRSLSLFEELKEDTTGVYFRTKPLDDVSWADDVLTQLRSGTLNNFSNGFQFIFDNNSMKWNDEESAIDIFQARLLEISVEDIPSDLQTFAIRSADDEENDLFEQTEDFIKSLPRRQQLEARKLIARHKSLSEIKPGEQEQNPPKEETPIAEERSSKKINYSYLISKL